MEKGKNSKKYEYKTVKNGIYDNQILINNICYFVQERNITRHILAELSDIPIETLNNFIYGESKDFKLNNAFKIASVLKVDMETLTGMPYADTHTDEIVRLSRALPENLRYYLKWSLSSLGKMYQQYKVRKKAIPIKDIVCENGYHTIGHEVDLYDVSDFPAEIRAKTILALKPTCDCFMPYASPYNVLLVANDRPPLNREIVACISSGKFWLVRKVNDKYHFLRDNKFCAENKDIDIIIGYVCHTTKKGEEGF